LNQPKGRHYRQTHPPRGRHHHERGRKPNCCR
jgi:hypothetical protein